MIESMINSTAVEHIKRDFGENGAGIEVKVGIKKVFGEIKSEKTGQSLDFMVYAQRATEAACFSPVLSINDTPPVFCEIMGYLVRNNYKVLIDVFEYP